MMLGWPAAWRAARMGVRQLHGQDVWPRVMTYEDWRVRFGPC